MNTDQPPVNEPQEVVQGNEEQTPEKVVEAATPAALTLGEQAEALLNAPEADKLSKVDRDYLTQIAQHPDISKSDGVLTPNPDGTWAPINAPTKPIVADSSKGEVKVYPAYGFKDPATTYHFPREAQGPFYADEQLTKKLAERIMREDPTWFRLNMGRRWRKSTDPYWEGATPQ